jgi:hypothetical protein
VHVNGKIRPVETIPGIGGWQRKIWKTWILLWYRKNFCKCHNITPGQW